MRTPGHAVWIAAGALGSVALGGAAIAHTVSTSGQAPTSDDGVVESPGAAPAAVVPLHLSSASIRTVYTVASVSETVDPVTADAGNAPEPTGESEQVTVVQKSEPSETGEALSDDGASGSASPVTPASVASVATPITPVTAVSVVSPVTPPTVVSPQETLSPVSPVSPQETLSPVSAPSVPSVEDDGSDD